MQKTLTNTDRNYRPILVLPLLSKILEITVNSQLMAHLEKENLLSEFQFGFRQNGSTELATTRRRSSTTSDEKSTMGNLSVPFLWTFLELSIRSVIVSFLQSYQLMVFVDGHKLHWFTSYLFHRTQLVEIDNTRSSEQPVYSGVPQGSIRGPLLLVFFFNDIVDSLLNSQIVMYADENTET